MATVRRRPKPKKDPKGGGVPGAMDPGVKKPRGYKPPAKPPKRKGPGSKPGQKPPPKR